MRTVNGLHHVTAISGPAQANLDFYAGVLGMRLVKRSVNQDDPGTYHLFYADAEGHAGTDLTFFPWDRMAPSREGHGLASEVTLAVPEGSLDWWGTRLTRYGARASAIESRFGERALPLIDPHGLRVALVEAAQTVGRGFTPWEASPVPVERQVRGLHGARVVERDLAATAAFLTSVLGFSPQATDGPWQRFSVAGGGSGRHLDVVAAPSGAHRGAWGTGSIHHLAWRVDDDAHELAMRAQVESGGAHPTPVIDRFWFKSVYFKEPGGVLFELATDGPGFAVDEAAHALGETLVLPPWLEGQRGQIQALVPPLVYPPQPPEIGMIVAAFRCILVLAIAAVGASAVAQTPPPATGSPMTATIKGPFDVKMTPHASSTGTGTDPTAVGRFTLDKAYHGDLEATSAGEMLAVRTAEKGSAGYVALENVTGTLAGRKGAFSLQHWGMMDKGTPDLKIMVVPDSGTGELAGLTGTMTIDIQPGGKHFYDFTYSLPAAVK